MNCATKITTRWAEVVKCTFPSLQVTWYLLLLSMVNCWSLKFLMFCYDYFAQGCRLKQMKSFPLRYMCRMLAETKKVGVVEKLLDPQQSAIQVLFILLCVPFELMLLWLSVLEMALGLHFRYYLCAWTLSTQSAYLYPHRSPLHEATSKLCESWRMRKLIDKELLCG